MNQPPEIDSTLPQAPRNEQDVGADVDRHSAVGLAPLQAPRIKLGAVAVRMLLLTVVAGGIGGLVWYALYVPAITSELSGWLGRPTVAVDTPEGRRSQVIFLLLVYSAPLSLGALVYVANFLIAGLNRRPEA